MSQKAILHQVTTVQTHLIQQRDVLQRLTLTLCKSGAAGPCLNGALLRCLRAAEDTNQPISIIKHLDTDVMEECAWSHLPVSVPLPIFLIRYGVQVRQRDDIATVGAQPLLIKSTFPVLQLSLVFVGNPDVRVIVIHAHSGHGGMVALQELLVHPLVML